VIIVQEQYANRRLLFLPFTIKKNNITGVTFATVYNENRRSKLRHTKKELRFGEFALSD
jgi:hypothetical protein